MQTRTADYNSKRKIVLILLCYLTVYIVWGSTYLFIKIAVDSIHPFVVLAFRFVFGGILLLGIARARGRIRTFPGIREILGSVLLGGLLLLGGNGLVTISEMQTDSSYVALIVAAAPVFVAFFDRVLFRKKITFIKLLGVLVGFAGIVLLFWTGQSIADTFSLPVILACAGVIIFSFGMSLRHKLPAPHDSFVNTGIQMLFAGGVALTASIISQQSIPEILAAATLPSLLSLLFLAVVGTLAFAAFNFLLHEEPSLRVSSYALVNPVIASVLGIALAGDKPVQFFFVSLPLVVAGIAFMLYGDRLVQLVRTRFFSGNEE
ncbi:MAG: EamA family transporter [Spirochaetales bacterium]|nr:EamA family transporter [Spirochaetales bacterium]